MHRQNVLVVVLLTLVSFAVLAAGYASGRGPFGVVSYAVSRLSHANRAGASVLTPEDKSSSAPEFAQGEWINSEPLTLKGLRGRVVLLEFWTFGCYNCRNTLPAVKSWDARYREKGLTVIGVHSPEFPDEKKLENLRREVRSLEIAYPVVTDNDYDTWRAYDVDAWPTILVLDKSGRVRWTHVGEGAYDETEQVIKKLLVEEKETGEKTKAKN